MLVQMSKFGNVAVTSSILCLIAAISFAKELYASRFCKLNVLFCNLSTQNIILTICVKSRSTSGFDCIMPACRNYHKDDLPENLDNGCLSKANIYLQVLAFFCIDWNVIVRLGKDQGKEPNLLVVHKYSNPCVISLLW